MKKLQKPLSLALAVSLLLTVMSAVKFAAVGGTWDGTVYVTEDQTVSDVIATNGCQLNISSGVTLTVKGTISVNGGDGILKVVGDGKLVVEAPNGKDGGTSQDQGFAGSNGLPAVQGSLVVENGVVEITGGSGGNAVSGGTYGIPGAGASAITGNLAVERGTVSVTGGSGGSTNTPAAGGSGQPAVAGSLTVRDGEVTITGGNGGSSSYGSAYSYGGSGGVGVAGGTLWISGGKVTVSGGFGGRGSVPAVSEHGGHGANANPTADRCSINWDGVVYCYDSEGRQTAVMNDICVTGIDLNEFHTITSFSLWERMLRELADGKSFETDYLTAPAGASVTIPQGLSVTVNGTLTAGDGTDTVTAKGEGTLTVHGKNGANGGYNATEGFAGHDGGSGVCGNLIIDGCDAEISGGSGGNAFVGGTNARAGNGAPAITGSLTVKDGFVTVNGGTGGYTDDGSWGGNAGAGVVGDLTVELGTVIISGGKGGNTNHQNAYGLTAGNGGDGVSGNALILGGSVTVNGNNGGSAVGFGRAGNGGSAVRGDLTVKGGSISLTGGTGGDHFLNEIPAQAGDGGSSVAGNVFFYGGSVYTEAGKSGTIPGEGFPSSDGKTVAGTFSNLSGRAVFALDSDGAVIYRFDETEYNDDEFREQIDRKTVISGINVTVTAGKGMVPAPASGDLSQCVVPNQPINDIVLIADGDSYFPEDYASVGTTGGISVIRNSSEQITVTGTPTADVTVALTAAAAKRQEQTPQAVFTATGADTGTLSGLSVGMKFRIDNGEWQTAEDESVGLTNLGPCTITVYTPGNGATTVDSEEQIITVTKAEVPALEATQPNVIGGTGSIPTGKEHQKSTNGTDWEDCDGEWSGLEAGRTYYVRIKASGAVLASEAQAIDINAFVPGTEQTPQAVFTATGADTGTLSGLAAGMKFRIDNGEWQTAEGESVGLTNLGPCTITVYTPGNGATTVDSEEQIITVTKAEVPALEATQPNVIGGTGSIPTGKEHQKSTNGTDWEDCDGEWSGLEAGRTYYVRIKASGAVLASEAQAIDINAFVPGTEQTPQAVFTATGADTGTLSGLAAGMKFRIDNGEWQTAEGESVGLTNLEPCTITVYTPGNGATTTDSEEQIITVTKAETPALEATQPETIYDKGLIPTTTAHEKSLNGTDWEGCGGLWTDLTEGTYYVRVKASGAALASDAQTIVISVARYTVKFVDEDGTELQSTVYACGETPVYTGETPVKEATAENTYTFAGWTPDIVPVDADATYTAVYDVTVNEYSVTFVTNGGTEIPPVQVAYGEPVTEPEAPEKKSFAFAGWYADESLETPYDFTAKITADTVVYAKWTPISYTVLSGEEAEWTKDSGTVVTIIVKRSDADETCIDHFAGVEIDGVPLENGTDYTAEKGSTVITLKAAALEELPVGEHTVTISFDDGGVETKLTVKEAPAPINPPTGESELLAALTAITAVSFAGFTVIAIRHKKRVSVD